MALQHAQFDRLRQFIGSDPLLQLHFAVYLQQHPKRDPDHSETYLNFLAVLIVYQRKTYRAHLVLPADVIQMLTAPDERGRHVLMDVVVAGFFRAGAVGDEQVRAWYYLRAVPSLQLAPFLSRQELNALAKELTPEGLDRWGASLSGDDAARLDPHFAGQLCRLAQSSADGAPHCRISIVGFHRSVLGIGEDARCLFGALLALGLSPELVDVSVPALERYSGADACRAFEVPRPTAPIVIFCMPVFEMPRVMTELALSFAPPPDQFRIGYWPWETDRLPPEWSIGFEMVDEIWASSKFLEQVYRAQNGGCLVTYVPPRIEIEQPVLPADLSELFQDGQFTFLSIFDFNSRIERKNPLGAVEAFKKAFPSSVRDVQLVFKTLNRKSQLPAFRALEAAIAADDRIVMIDGPLSKPELCGLIKASSALLSLHRSEGFGRVCAEAMLLDTPVVATDWSGSVDFLDSSTGFPVRCTLREVGIREYPFAAGRWAEPNLDDAAAQMRRLYEAKVAPRSLLLAARNRITTTYAGEAVSAYLARRLAAIEKTVSTVRARRQPGPYGISTQNSIDLVFE